MDTKLKEAFDKIKEDIYILSKEVYNIRISDLELKQHFNTINNVNHEMKNDLDKIKVDNQEAKQNYDTIKNSNLEIKKCFDSITGDNLELKNSIPLLKKYLDHEIAKLSDNLGLTLISNLNNLSFQMKEITEKLDNLSKTPIPTHNPTEVVENPTDSLINPTIQQVQEPLKDQKTPFSIGNRGVPTDKPTDKPTDTLGSNTSDFEEFTFKEDKISKFDEASRMLDTLDTIKKEIRYKFKQLTPMEMEVFSLLYSLDENGENPDYRLIALKLNLSESSIRDYISRITSKGIPIIKEKINNKKVILRISSDLKKIATLDTILKLRDI